MNPAVGIVLSICEDGPCRYNYDNENKTVLENLNLLVERKTRKIENKNIMDIVDFCTRERANIRLRF